MNPNKPSTSIPAVEASLLPIPLGVQRPESLLRLPEVIHRAGMCKSMVYKLPGFPKPIKLGRSSVWIETEVAGWIDDRIAEGRRQRGA